MDDHASQMGLKSRITSFIYKERLSGITANWREQFCSDTIWP
jgi:hypothetical protein